MATQFKDENIVSWESNGETYHKIYCDPEDLVDSPLWWHKQRLQQTTSGYGSKLTSRYKIDFNGKLYRLYVTIYSNVGSTWFKTGDRKIFVS